MIRKDFSFTGIVFIVIGIIFLLNNLGLLDFSFVYLIADWWPVGLILAGILFMYNKKKMGFAILAITFVFLFLYGVDKVGDFAFENVDNLFWIPGVNCVSGSGNVTVIERAGIDFSELEASSGVNVYVTQGPKSPIRIEAEDNLIELVKFQESGDALKVSLTRCIRAKNPVNVYVSSDTITKFDAVSSAKIIGENEITADNLEIDANSAGEVSLEIDAQNVVVESSSAAKIYLDGTADNLEVEATSAGYVYAFELKADEVIANANSAGIVQVYAIDKLDATANSAGKIQYKGMPSGIIVDENSGGDVTNA